MAGSWLVHRQGREQFLDEGGLKSLAAGGKLVAGDLVYHPTLGRWLYAREVEEITRELDTATRLGRAAGEQIVPHNDAAIAGFTLGVLAIVPVFGVLCALIGLPLSLRGLGRARALGGVDRRFATAGISLTIASLLINGVGTLLAFMK